MSSVLPPRRPIVLKASRDTLLLLAAAGAMTLAIAYSVHNHPLSDGPGTEQVADGEWTGQLADLSPNQAATPAPAEPLTSDALTVPKAAMALPAAPKATPPAKPAPAKARPVRAPPGPSPSLPSRSRLAASRHRRLQLASARRASSRNSIH